LAFALFARVRCRQADRDPRKRSRANLQLLHRTFGRIGNYAAARDWRFQLGFVDPRPAIVASDPNDRALQPTHFVLLHWAMGHIDIMRDFRHARYVMEAAEIILSE